MGKLQLNDAALTYTAESSVALGFGFRCGFLGLLHMEIVQERLRREYQMDIIATYPSVVYEVTQTNGEVLMIDNPMQMPDPSVIEHIAEPMVKAFIMVPEREHRRHHAARHGKARHLRAHRIARRQAASCSAATCR